MKSNYDPSKHHRRSIRLPGYDYASPGTYFVTIVTNERECIFDNVDFRRVAEYNWRAIAQHFANVVLDEWIIMPNHIHGIIMIIEDERRGKAFAKTQSCANEVGIVLTPSSNTQGLANALPLHGVEPGSLGAIIGNFKSITTRRINKIRNLSGVSIWQRNYYEHIVRDENDLNRIREYVVTNPVMWQFDRENENCETMPDQWKSDERNWFSRLVSEQIFN